MAQISLVAKPLSLACLILISSWVAQKVGENAPLLRHYAGLAIVRLEYRTEASCLGLNPDTAVVYMDNGKISKVSRVGDDFKFSVGDCKFPE
jgi:hypothetical protein